MKTAASPATQCALFRSPAGWNTLIRIKIIIRMPFIVIAQCTTRLQRYPSSAAKKKRNPTTYWMYKMQRAREDVHKRQMIYRGSLPLTDADCTQTHPGRDSFDQWWCSASVVLVVYESFGRSVQLDIIVNGPHPLHDRMLLTSQLLWNHFLSVWWKKGDDLVA